METIAVIEFNEDVTPQSIARLINNVNQVVKERGNIPVVHITTRGGDLNSALLFSNFLKTTGIKIVTVAVDMVASAGVMLWSEGVRREFAPDATLLLHQPRFVVPQHILLDEVANKRYLKNPLFDKKFKKQAEHYKNLYFYTIGQNLGVDSEELKNKAGTRDWIVCLKEAKRRGWIANREIK